MKVKLVLELEVTPIPDEDGQTHVSPDGDLLPDRKDMVLEDLRAITPGDSMFLVEDMFQTMGIAAALKTVTVLSVDAQ